MGMHALKQVMQEIKDSADTAGRHLSISMPTLFRKHKNRVGEMRRVFKQQDYDAAARANLDATKKGLDRPYDLTDPKSVKGAGDKEFREKAGDSIVDTALEGTKYIFKGEGGDWKSRMKEVAEHGLDGVKDPETRLKLLRSYMIAAKSEYAESLATGAAVEGLYEVYIDGTPAEGALTKEQFTTYVESTRDLAKDAKDLPKPPESNY